jgi:hypothetical protein
MASLAVGYEEPEHPVRRKKFPYHAVPVPRLVDDVSFELNLHEAFRDGLTDAQGRCVLRDMERLQRKLRADAGDADDAAAERLAAQRRAAAATEDRSELQLLTQALFSVKGRLSAKCASVEAGLARARSAAPEAAGTTASRKRVALYDALRTSTDASVATVSYVDDRTGETTSDMGSPLRDRWATPVPGNVDALSPHRGSKRAAIDVARAVSPPRAQSTPLIAAVVAEPVAVTPTQRRGGAKKRHGVINVASLM